MDNECPNALKQFMREENMTFQLTPAEMHRTNTAERAIRTGKNHFLAGLASTDPSFPAALWDQLFEQWYITLNLLRQSRLNPRLSAYAQLEGQFDYNKTPLAPPGIIAVGHVKPDARKSWDFHGKPGFYVSTAMEHYRCWNLYLPETNTTRNFDTVSFHPHSFKTPAISSADAATHAARNLTHALLNPQPASPIARSRPYRPESTRRHLPTPNHRQAQTATTSQSRRQCRPANTSRSGKCPATTSEGSSNDSSEGSAYNNNHNHTHPSTISEGSSRHKSVPIDSSPEDSKHTVREAR